MKAVATDAVLVGEVTGDRVRRGRRRQAAEESSIEDRDMWHVELPAGSFDAGNRPRVVQRRQRDEVADLPNGRVVQDHRIGEVRAAVHNTMSHRSQSHSRKINSGSSEFGVHLQDRLIMIGNRTARFTDPLH